MNRLEQLIFELCPYGVEYKSIQEVFTLKNGYTPSKANPLFWENGVIPWFRMEDIRINGRILYDSIQHITPQAVKGNKLFPKDSIIIATTATIGEHALLKVNALANQQFTCLSKKADYEQKLDMKYFYYYCFLLGEWCKNNINTASFASVDMEAFKSLKIPLPPLEIQNEIVRILDNFTITKDSLIKELEKEFLFRKKQYNYYRDLLLDFKDIEKKDSKISNIFKDSQNNKSNNTESKHTIKAILERKSYPKKLKDLLFKLCPNGVEYKALGEVCEIYDGTHQTPKYTNQGVKFISVENIENIYESKKFISFEDYKLHYKNKVVIGDVLMTRIGTVGKCAIITTNEELAYYVSLALLKPNRNILNSAFLRYFIESSHGKQELNFRILHTAIPIKINKSDIGKLKIPLPPLEIQNEIVGILDRFETLTNDLTTGIPAEIALRKKQYEYYRNKLLSFREIGQR